MPNITDGYLRAAQAAFSGRTDTGYNISPDMEVDHSQLSPIQQIRRVVLVCVAFDRNLAYYRVGLEIHERCQDLRDGPTANFWRVVCNNSLDIAVLEWCKLFADRKGKHHWRKFVTDPNAFESDLLARLGLETAGLQQCIKEMLHYRDKFIAHLDSERTMNIPKMEIARQAISSLHAEIVRNEAVKSDLAGLPLNLDDFYEKSREEAIAVYQQFLVVSNTTKNAGQ